MSVHGHPTTNSPTSGECQKKIQALSELVRATHLSPCPSQRAGPRHVSQPAVKHIHLCGYRIQNWEVQAEVHSSRVQVSWPVPTFALLETHEKIHGVDVIYRTWKKWGNKLKKSKQTQLCLQARVHKGEEGRTVNTDTQITMRALETFDSALPCQAGLQNSSARQKPTIGVPTGMWLEWEFRVCPEWSGLWKSLCVTRLSIHKWVNQNTQA